MFRHIFMATFKIGVSEEIKAEALDTFKKLYDNIPQAVNPQIGFSTGWVGAANQLVLTADFNSKEDFNVYMTHPKHLELIDKAQNVYFDPKSFVVAQFEF